MLLEHVIWVNPVKNNNPDKSFNLRGSFGLQDGNIQRKPTCIVRVSQELIKRFTSGHSQGIKDLNSGTKNRRKMNRVD